MKKSDFNTRLREHVRRHVSPTPDERSLVTAIYDALQTALGASNCLQIGSYARFTSITPLHDLDVLYVLGNWPGNSPDPSMVLRSLKGTLDNGFKNPTAYALKITEQSHSITMSFVRGQDEMIGVDVVPAYAVGRNEFGKDIYMVPEIANRGHARRQKRYDELARTGAPMGWIKTDPRGYIEAATRLNDANADYRHAVKFAKGWKHSCKEDFDCALKSFHVEQAMASYFIADRKLDMFEAVFRFFHDLPHWIEKPRLLDRADASKYIDEYVARLTELEKKRMLQARDHILRSLEDFEPDSNVAQLLQGRTYVRASPEESYLFDSGIPTLTETPLEIVATVLPRTGGFRGFILNALGLIEIDRKIEFRLRQNDPNSQIYKWKVKNDDTSPQPRGEITDHRTKNDPEHSKYNGAHYVECFGIRDGVCVARGKQNVLLKSPYSARTA